MARSSSSSSLASPLPPPKSSSGAKPATARSSSASNRPTAFSPAFTTSAAGPSASAVDDARSRGHSGAWKLPSFEFARSTPSTGGGAGDRGGELGFGLWLATHHGVESPEPTAPVMPQEAATVDKPSRQRESSDAVRPGGGGEADDVRRSASGEEGASAVGRPPVRQPSTSKRLHKSRGADKAIPAATIAPAPAPPAMSTATDRLGSLKQGSSSSAPRRQPSLPSSHPSSKAPGKEMRRPSLFSLRSSASSSPNTSHAVPLPLPPPPPAAPPLPAVPPISAFAKLRDSVFAAVLPSSSSASSSSAAAPSSRSTPTAAATSSRDRIISSSSTIQGPRAGGGDTPEIVQTPPPLDDNDGNDDVFASDYSYFSATPAAGRSALGGGRRTGSGSSTSLLSAGSVSDSLAPVGERRSIHSTSPQRPVSSSSLLDLPTPMAAGPSSTVTSMGRKLRPRSSTDPPTPDMRHLAPGAGVGGGSSSGNSAGRSPRRRESASTGSPSRTRPLSIRRLSSSLFHGSTSSSASSVSTAGGAGGGGSVTQPDFGALFGASPGSKSPSKLFGMSRGLATPPIVEDHVANPASSSSLFALHPGNPSRQSSSSSLALAPSDPRPILRRGSSAGSGRRNSLASSTGSWTGSRAGSSQQAISGGGGAMRRGSDDVRKWEADVPRREAEEGVDEWLSRLREVVPRSEIATILASNGDEFHVSALRTYMLSFDLSLLPLDIALRKLLMEVSLPRETQQIDRVMEAFAQQYVTSNPGLFISEDHPYILAFSLIMLHTDAFNRSNKNKMTKADYIKNTRLDGVNLLVLDTFFDNITFTPFVFIEDELDVNGSRSLAPEASPSNLATSSPFGAFSTTPTTTSFLSAAKPSSSNKIDVYYLISTSQIHTLRCADVALQIPRKTPFGYHGPRGFFDTGELHASFAEADMIEVGEQAGDGGARRGSGSSARTEGKAHSLKLTKYGVLSRKEETSDGGKKSTNRKWKEWSVILTGSQLLFFKDTTWALVLRNQADEHGGRKTPGAGGKLLLPKMTSFRPDEILSVKDCIAITDTTYSKYANAFRFVMPHGRQYILQASDEDELGEWMSRINYAAAFKTASVRMRGMGMTGGQAQLAGAAAAASHAKALKSESKGGSNGASSVRTIDSAFYSATQNREPGRPRASTSTLDTFPANYSVSSGGSQLAPPSPKPGFTSRLRSSSKPPEIALESPIGPSVDGGEQLESAFIEVKAELAAGRGGVPRLASSVGPAGADQDRQRGPRARAVSVGTPPTSARASFEKIHGGLGVELAEFGTSAARSNHASRAEAIQLKVDQLKDRIRSTEQQLDAELRTTRNLAILAPFRKTTRERIAVAVPALAKKIRTLRLELARFRCYDEILEKDLRIEEDEWKLVKHIAHQAARSSLSNQRATLATPRKPSLPTSAHLTIPDLEISMHTGTTPPAQHAANGRMPVPPQSDPTTPPPKNGRGARRTSSVVSDSASFHSAVDEFHTTVFDDLSGFEDDDQAGGRESTVDEDLVPPSWPAPLLDSGPPTPPASRILLSSDPRPLHPDVPSASAEDEPAEAWSQTRAGKRVSLAEVPTETVRRISLQLKRNSVEDIRRRAARESRTAVGRSGLGPGAARLDPAVTASRRPSAGGDDDDDDREADLASLLTVDTVTPVVANHSGDMFEPDRIAPLPSAPQ